MKTNSKKINYLGFGFILLVLLILIVSRLLDFRLLEFLGLVMLGSTIVPLPLDSYILYSTKFYSPLFIGIFGGLFGAVAIIYEKYFLKLVIKARVLNNFLMFFGNLKITKLIKNNMFLWLIISAFSFIPFEPFRLVAVMKNYNDFKYFLAAFLGRGLRFYFLGLIGLELLKYDWLGIVITISIVLFLIVMYKSYLEHRKNGIKR